MSIRPVGDFVQFSIGGGWGSEQPSEDFAPVAVIRGTDIPRLKNGDFSSIPNRFESEKKLKNRLLVPGDIVLETAGGSAATGQFTGRSLLVTKELLARTGPAICASFCKRIQLYTELIEPSFFQHFLEEMYSSGRVARYDSQSTGISNFQFKSFLESEMVDFPELPIQRAASRVLRDIDAKRVLNFEVSNTLEALAGTIFKSWFIDFDPVRAKMAGESPFGIDAETAALFPDSMEDSELGEIPTGWTHEQLGSFARVSGGKQLSKDEFVPGGDVPVLGGAGEMGFTNKSNADGFVITVGRVGVNCGRFVANNGPTWVNNNASRVVPSEAGHEEWLLLALQSLDLDDIKKGAAQPFVSNRDLLEKRIVLPTSEVLESFSSIVKPIFRFNENVKNQNVLLASLRGALLPRLISGELEIPEEMLAA